MANDTSTQVDVGLLGEMADTCERAIRSFQAQVPYSLKLKEIDILQKAGFAVTKAETYDDSVNKYVDGLSGLIGSIRSYVANANGNDEKIEKEMPDEDDRVAENNEEEASTNMDEGKTDGVEDSSMDAKKDAEELTSGDNKDGESGNYKDETEGEKEKDLKDINNEKETEKQDYKDVTDDVDKKDLNNINDDEETEKKNYKDETDDNDKEDLKDPNKKKNNNNNRTPSPEDLITQFFESLDENQISVILQAMNSGETEEITLEQIVADEKYLTKLRSILNSNSNININQNTLNALSNLDNTKLKEIMLKTIAKSGISSAVSI